jgi:hypothetical protein
VKSRRELYTNDLLALFSLPRSKYKSFQNAGKLNDRGLSDSNLGELP